MQRRLPVFISDSRATGMPVASEISFWLAGDSSKVSRRVSAKAFGRGMVFICGSMKLVEFHLVAELDIGRQLSGTGEIEDLLGLRIAEAVDHPDNLAGLGMVVRLEFPIMGIHTRGVSRASQFSFISIR